MKQAKKKRRVPDAMSGTPLRSVCGILCGQRKFAKPYSFKKLQKKTPETVGFQVLFWSCWADSNRRPHPYQVQKSCCGLPLVIVPYRLYPFIFNGCGIFLVVSCCFLLCPKSS